MATETLPHTGVNGEAAVDEFIELETKIQTVTAALRQARAELRPLQAAHEQLLRAHALAERELAELRKERQEIRQRIARLVNHLETAAS